MNRSLAVAACVTLAIGMAETVCAQSPREMLNQLATQLRASPGDTALRERIIRLAQEIKPPPAVPEEAERRLARGIAGFQGAKSQDEYRIAAREFQAAADAAPWFADAYFNLGMSLDKAGDFAAAISNLRLALLASPDSRETKSLLYQVEFRQEQANSAATQAAKNRGQEQSMLQSLDGARFVLEQMSGGAPFMRYVVEIRGTQLTYRSIYLVGGASESVVGTCVLQDLQCELTQRYAYTEPMKLQFRISPDGREAVYSSFGSGVRRQELIHRRVN